jgi:hypothetical protein
MAATVSRGERLSVRDTAKFGILVGLGAIFIDAAVAHGLFWENDPYWTYWITKSFLIATVFTVGTAFIGIGVVQGLILTAVHTAILESYYEWLAPVGLPQQPEWLDDNHLWITGVPAHYLAILAGYLLALWIWRRGAQAEGANPADERARTSPAALASSSLVATLIVLILSGIITHGLLMGEFPGITYFVQHFLVGFVFIYVWSAYVGMGGAGWSVGALMLALVWASYGIYLGPVGLPNEVHYLTHHQIWSRSFPGDLVAALLGLFVTVRLLPRVSPRLAAYALLPLALLAAPNESEAKPRGLHASASASGEAHRVLGPNPVDLAAAQPANGTISIRVIEGGGRWSPVQGKDWVELAADFTAPDGSYRVLADKVMPSHPLGKYTTWNGVALNHEMHGETGIGTSNLPLMTPDISLYGWGKVWRNGQLIAPMAPVHVMVTTKGAMPGVMLEVDTEDKMLAGVPDGYITVHWPAVASLRMPRETLRNVRIMGWIGLIGLTALFGWLAIREERRQRT